MYGEKKYVCPICGKSKFIAHQIIRVDMLVGADGLFLDNLPGSLESHIYDSEDPYGPYTCTECNTEYDELPVREMVQLPRGTFTVARKEAAATLKKLGYGYHHENNGFIVVGNGTRAFAVAEEDYKTYFGGQKSFML